MRQILQAADDGRRTFANRLQDVHGLLDRSRSAKPLDAAGRAAVGRVLESARQDLKTSLDQVRALERWLKSQGSYVPPSVRTAARESLKAVKRDLETRIRQIDGVARTLARAETGPLSARDLTRFQQQLSRLLPAQTPGKAEKAAGKAEQAAGAARANTTDRAAAVQAPTIRGQVVRGLGGRTLQGELRQRVLKPAEAGDAREEPGQAVEGEPEDAARGARQKGLAPLAIPLPAPPLASLQRPGQSIADRHLGELKAAGDRALLRAQEDRQRKQAQQGLASAQAAGRLEREWAERERRIRDRLRRALRQGRVRRGQGKAEDTERDPAEA